MSPVLKSWVASMETHLTNRNKPGMTKTEVRRIVRTRAKRNGIIIDQLINIKNLIRMGMDCQILMMVICRRHRYSCHFEITRDTFEKMGRKREYAL